MLMRPVSANGANRIDASYRHHHQTFYKRRPVGIYRYAVIGVNIFNNNRFAMQHRPATNATMHWETLPFPQWANGVFIGIIAHSVVAQNKGSAIGAAYFA